MRKIPLYILAALSATLFAGEFKSSFPEYTRIWIGSDYWANRLQDWRVTMGRLECLNGDESKPMRTVHWLTGDIQDSDEPFQISVRTGSLGYYSDTDGSSWSGLLIGAGAGQLDYRSAALIHHLPGKGGGLLAVFDDHGEIKFLSNENEESPEREVLARSWPSVAVNRTGSIGNHEDYRIDLNGSHSRNGLRDLSVTITDMHSGNIVNRATLASVPDNQIRGGIAMVSHGGKTAQRRYWFRDFAVSGDAIERHPDRQYGPILGAIYSVSDNTLKLNAQFPPLGFNDSREATLEIRSGSGDSWEPVATVPIEAPSYTALFRLENFNTSRDNQYRIVYENGATETYFQGRIAAFPKKNDAISILGLTCYQVMARPADGGWGDGFIGSPEGRWTDENVWFPHNELIQSIEKQQPNLIALLGDQMYEGGNPTNSDHSEGNPHIDYLYKWYLTLWDLGRITRNFPTVALTDDHDVYQGDLWGDGGTASVNGQNKQGGYVHEPEFVNMVERTQTAANPDPATGVSMKQGLSNYFTTFSLGDVEIAIIEDRKFKSLPTLIGPTEQNGSKIIESGYDPKRADIPNGTLLGSEQEEFLDSWTRQNRDRVKIGLTQTTYASLHTDPDGAKWLDIDSGGWPQSGRNRALEIFKQGNVVLMAGDTHLPSVIQHGTKTYRDSVWQFTVPAVANKYRRWWTPAEPGANRRENDPEYTGDQLDGLGNRVTVAAAGNPTLSNTEVFAENQRRGMGYASEHLLLDSSVTKDGYGLIKISPDRKSITLECWPAFGPNGQEPSQHEGWPVKLSRPSPSQNWKQE